MITIDNFYEMISMYFKESTDILYLQESMLLYDADCSPQQLELYFKILAKENKLKYEITITRLYAIKLINNSKTDLVVIDINKYRDRKKCYNI